MLTFQLFFNILSYLIRICSTKESQVSDKTKLTKFPARESITINIQKKQIERLQAIKKAKDIPISRIIDQLIDEPLEKEFNNL